MNSNVELIDLCHRILEDRQLTEEEVRALHDWLHAHPDSWKQWPASVLIDPVHAALEDDHLIIGELGRIANVLFNIECEWSAKRTDELIEEAIRAFDMKTPLMPTIPLEVPVADGSNGLKVDLAQHQCSCSEWSSQRGRHPSGHIGRCCKHVARAFLNIIPEHGWPDWFQALISDCELRGRGTHADDDWAVISIESNHLLASSGTAGWSSVFAPAKIGKYQRFSYSWRDRRWSYGIQPPHSATIAAALHQRFGY